MRMDKLTTQFQQALQMRSRSPSAAIISSSSPCTC